MKPKMENQEIALHITRVTTEDLLSLCREEMLVNMRQ